MGSIASMLRWLARVAMAGLLGAPVVVLAGGPTAHAGLLPLGPCTYQAAFASASLTPVTAGTEAVHANAGFGPNITVPPSNCAFAITGNFYLTGSSLPLPCVPYEFGGPALLGLGTDCVAAGTVPAFPIAAMEFIGTIRAVSDNRAAAVSCLATFDGSGGASCFFGDPGAVHTL